MSNRLLASDVRVWRETDATGINAILNHPEVRPWVEGSGDGPLDISSAVENTDNILLMGEFGAVFFILVMPGTYECHTQVLPEGRGEWAFKFAIAVLDWMFMRSNAWEVTTRVPAGHIAALALTRSVGFNYEFTSMEPCLFRGVAVKPSVYRLSIHEWVTRSQAALEAGERLHGQMADEAIRLGIAAPPHEDDAHHNHIAGAAIEMVRAGLVTKGVFYYNRWSVLSRHRTISVVSTEPVVVRMDIGAMRVKDNGIEIVP